MTSWFRTYGSSFLGFVICSLMVVVCAEASRPADSACWSPSITSCTECLRRGPQCAWCFEEGFLDGAGPNFRCDLLVNLLSRGCGSEFIEQSDIKVKVNAGASSTQVSPQDINITLTAGSESSFLVAVKQLQRYPLDLYYLVDISASMQENLDHLKTVGVALSLRMTEHTSNLWLGFGSFVDKPVSPYINVHPSKINNPCSDYDIRCRPAHGFHHVLSMTGNLTEFTRVIKRQRISGNMDTPEGGLDAMLQAAVCQTEVGWRPEAKRLLLLMTDQTSHLALDSRLAGIVTPHDGLCHLENNVYTESTRMDYPSLNQLSDKLLENSIYSIFAVEKQQYQWYKELVSFLPGSYLGKIGLFQAPNLIDLVVDAYKRLLSEVAVSVSVEDKAVNRFWVSISPLCPDGSTTKGQSCSGVQPNQTVYFNITIGLHSCPDDEDEEDVTVMIRPVGYNESSTVRIHSKCRCTCGQTGQCHDSSQSRCNGTVERTDEEQRPERGLLKESSCRADGADVDCSGRGVCDCGKCVCEQSKLGHVYGKYCEMDNFSCPYEGGLLCGGRGVCVSGECVCDGSWTGATCGCQVSTASCQSSDGAVCSGWGRCVCGECVCDDERYSGRFCERCPACQSSCQSYWQCVDCQLSHGLTQGEAGHCNQTCTTLVDYIDDVSGLQGDVRIQCVYVTKDGCHYRFQANSELGRTRLHISTRPGAQIHTNTEIQVASAAATAAQCPSHGRLVGTFLSVCALTVLCGLVMVAVSRLLLQKKKSWSPGGATENRGFHCTGKDLSFIPTANEKTVTYRRDHPKERPLEMRIQVPKMPLGESWQC